jgi:hypothetical protein
MRRPLLRTSSPLKPKINRELTQRLDHLTGAQHNHLVLHEAGGKLEFAYFPNRGLISLVVVMEDGRTVEAGMLGNEGFTGIPAAVGLGSTPLQAAMQITGTGFG